MTIENIKAFIIEVLYEPAIAGMVGSLISILWHKPTLNIICVHLLSGFFCALYGTRPFIEWQEINSNATPLIAMMIGTFSGSFFGAVFEFVRSGGFIELMKELFRDFVRYLHRRTTASNAEKHDGGSDE